MLGTKPDVSNLQEFGVEAWIHRRVDQRQDAKFDARGGHCPFVGYPSNKQGFLLWCPGRGKHKIATTNHVVFGHICTRFTKSPVELLESSSALLTLDTCPAALTLSDINQSVDLRIVGTFETNLVLADSSFQGFRSMPPSLFPAVLKYTMKRNFSEVHLSLADSALLVQQPLTDAACVAGHESIPKSITQALSPSFVADWGPAIDRENNGFRQHDCFEAVKLPPGARTRPGIWVFSRKRHGTAKARFCVSGHRQILRP